MITISDIFETAKMRQVEADNAYAGCVTPDEAFQLCVELAAVLIDVRTLAELTYIGRTPWGQHVEWQQFPTMEINQSFVQDLKLAAPADKPLLFLCRSGVRSHHAAIAATKLGFEAYNILEGFEGQLDKEGHRNNIDGWRFRKLPWFQT